MVAADIADDAEPVFGVIRDRTAEAVLVESAGTAEAEIRIAAGDVDGLCAGRSCEQKKAQTKQDEFIHRITILSDVRFAGSFCAAASRAEGGERVRSRCPYCRGKQEPME